MKLEIIKMKPDHLREIGFFDDNEEIPEWAEYKATTEDSFTGIADGDIIACFGVAMFWEGMGELWMLPGDKFKKHGLSVVVDTHKIIDDLIEKNNIRHLYSDVLEENTVARRFIQHYGFVQTGHFKYYDPLGRNVIRYSREVYRARSGT